MKKIIDGKKYDTDTAKEVGYYSSSYARNDFHFYEETLYLKKSGEYFLHGEGNAMSRYARATGMHGWDPGERIMPLTYDDARQWAEEHMDADDYEEVFGEVPEDDDGKASINVRVSRAAADAIKRQSQITGLSVTKLIEQYAEGLRDRG